MPKTTIFFYLKRLPYIFVNHPHGRKRFLFKKGLSYNMLGYDTDYTDFNYTYSHVRNRIEM